MLHSGKGLLPPPVIGQRCIIPTTDSKLLGTPVGGYSSWQSPINDFKCTYKWIGRPLFWSLKYGQLYGPPDDLTCQHKRPNRLRTTTNAACIRGTKLASGDRTGYLRSWTARPFRISYIRVHISELCIFLREAQPVCRSYGAQVLNSGGGYTRPGRLPHY